MPAPPRKILVVRNDRLGDFMLAFPAFFLLRQALAEAEIHALVPEYTLEMATVCRAIDHAVLDPGRDAPQGQHRALGKRLRAGGYDAVITLFSTFRVGWHVFRAGIPYRLAPATKIAQVFYNRRLAQRRSRSAKPEWEYNVDLARALLEDFGLESPEPVGPYLVFSPQEIGALRAEFCRARDLDPGVPLVFIHPGSGGSANNLSPAQFGTLARHLHEHGRHTTIVSTGPGEDAIAEQVAERLADRPHAIYRSTEGLRRFAQHIAFADVFISGSTGPLHVAGALDRPTAGFYPLLRSSTALRWQTLSAPERRLAFSPSGDGDMASVDVAEAAATIGRTFLANRPLVG